MGAHFPGFHSLTLSYLHRPAPESKVTDQTRPVFNDILQCLGSVAPPHFPAAEMRGTDP